MDYKVKLYTYNVTPDEGVLYREKQISHKKLTGKK